MIIHLSFEVFFLKKECPNIGCYVQQCEYLLVSLVFYDYDFMIKLNTFGLGQNKQPEYQLG